MKPPYPRCVLVPLVGLVCLIGSAPVVEAQDIHVLAPTRHEAIVGDRIEVRVVRDRKVRTWPAERIDWFMVRVAGTQENRERPEPTRSDGEALAVDLVHGGMTLIALDLEPRVEEVPAARLDAFLADSLGIIEPENGEPRLAGQAVRIRRVESLKTLVRVLDREKRLTPTAVAQSKSGQRVEIRPLADPTATPVGSDLPVKVYVPDFKAGLARVIATHVESGKTQSFVPGPQRAGRVRIDAAGIWRIEAHHALRALPTRDATEGSDFAWTISSATLTFEVDG